MPDLAEHGSTGCGFRIEQNGDLHPVLALDSSEILRSKPYEFTVVADGVHLQ